MSWRLNELAQRMTWYLPGATTLGVVCKDGVVLASEKRASYGYLVLSKAAKKVFLITRNIGAACAGLIGDMQVLVREVSAYANLFELEHGRPIGVRAAAKLMSNLLFNRRLFPFITQTIVGGVDDEGPSIYTLDPLGSVIADKFAAVGSGAEIAIGVLEDLYRDDMSTSEGRDMVLRAMKSAMSRDAASGDGVDLLVITEKEGKEETILFK